MLLMQARQSRVSLSLQPMDLVLEAATSGSQLRVSTSTKIERIDNHHIIQAKPNMLTYKEF